MIHECISIKSSPILFNASLSSSTVPFSWKQANVCAVHKKDDKSCVNNYRPISLLCCVEKVFERLIFKRLFSFLQENNVLTSFQSGFIPGDSSVNQLTFLYNVFCKALDDGLEVRSVFFDISKAFDRVWHKDLLHKHKSTGVSGELLLWFINRLTNRQLFCLGRAPSVRYCPLGCNTDQSVCLCFALSLSMTLSLILALIFGSLQMTPVCILLLKIQRCSYSPERY